MLKSIVWHFQWIRAGIGPEIHQNLVIHISNKMTWMWMVQLCLTNIIMFKSMQNLPQNQSRKCLSLIKLLLFIQLCLYNFYYLPWMHLCMYWVFYFGGFYKKKKINRKLFNNWAFRHQNCNSGATICNLIWGFWFHPRPRCWRKQQKLPQNLKQF